MFNVFRRRLSVLITSLVISILLMICNAITFNKNTIYREHNIQWGLQNEQNVIKLNNLIYPENKIDPFKEICLSVRDFVIISYTV